MKMENDSWRNKMVPKSTTETATVPTAVTAIVRLRVKFCATSAQKNRTLPQSNVVVTPLLVVRDASVGEPHDPPAHPVNYCLIMSGDDDGGPFGVDACEQRHDLVRCFGIEVAGGLVAQKDQRIVDERSRDGRPLLLAARQFVREHLALVRDADKFEHARHAAHDVARTRTGHLECVGDVLPDRLLLQQFEVLKHDADLASQERDLAGRDAAQ